MKHKRARSWEDGPYRPEGPRLTTDDLSLEECIAYVTELAEDQRVVEEVMTVVESWRSNPESRDPLADLQAVMESIRAIPRGDERLSAMNSLVRTAGQPDVLADFLDVLINTLRRPESAGGEIARLSQQSRKHANYGWAGDTVVCASLDDALDSILRPAEDVASFLEFPFAKWGLNIHVWQPNASAPVFPSGGAISSGSVAEPPHSHPFDFLSAVVIGEFCQSTYRQAATDADADASPLRYNGMQLHHVDGVWPPHDFRYPANLETLESQVRLAAGDSYYMACDVIHDVEVEVDIASTRPAITLFLSTEAVVTPHVYMAQAMADFHDERPNLEYEATALSVEAWVRKLRAIQRYIRGESDSLDLPSIVQHRSDYAFFHG